MAGTLYVNVSDTTAVTDSVVLEDIEEGVVVQDTVTVTDTVHLSILILIHVQDTVTVNDSAQVRRPPNIKYTVLQLGFKFGYYEITADA